MFVFSFRGLNTIVFPTSSTITSFFDAIAATASSSAGRENVKYLTIPMTKANKITATTNKTFFFLEKDFLLVFSDMISPHFL
ncbi:hypothetical protein D3C73_1517090 [compost metagenome]